MASLDVGGKMLTVGCGMVGFVVAGCGLELPDLNSATLILTGLGVTAFDVTNCDCDVPCTCIATVGVADWVCDVLGMAGKGVADLARDGLAEWGVTALGGAGLDHDRMVEGPGKAGWSVTGPDATVIPHL